MTDRPFTALDSPPLLICTGSRNVSDPARWRKFRRYNVLTNCRVADSFSLECRQIHIVAKADVVALDNAAEHSKDCFGLVEWNEVASVEDAREGKVAKLADVAANVAVVDDDVSVAG